MNLRTLLISTCLGWIVSGASAERLVVPPGAEAYAIRAVSALQGNCGGDLKPDLAVIVGGMSAESVKPVEANERLDRQLAVLKAFVAERGGRLVLLERVRAARQSPPEPRGPRGDALPFLAVQRLEIELPASVDIDAVLERVLQTGLDRFGRGFRLDRAEPQPKPVVLYRFKDPAQVLEALHQRCRAEVFKRACAEGALAEDAPLCRDPAQADRCYRTAHLSLQSRYLTEHGEGSWHASHPWTDAQLATLEVLGAIPLRLHGTISLVPVPGRCP
jgi:hypothetical protein